MLFLTSVYRWKNEVNWLDIASKSVPLFATGISFTIAIFGLALSIHIRLDRLERQSQSNNDKLNLIEARVVEDHYNIRELKNKRDCVGLGEK